MVCTPAGTALNLPESLAAALGGMLLVLAVGWARERRLAAQRRIMQRLYKLGEELTAGRSCRENLRLLQSALPELLGVTEVHVYSLDRASNRLQRLQAGAGPERLPLSTPVDDPGSFRGKAVEWCFRNQSLIAVPDARQSPFARAGAPDTPRSAMFVPMFAQDDLLGVLVIEDARRERHFSEDEQAVAQHLGNQIAIGIKLLEQKSLREQTLASDRLDAICQLVAGTASEMRDPIRTIAGASEAALALQAEAEVRRGLTGILTEAQRVDGILSRLLRFATLREEERAVDLVALLRGLVRLREPAWRVLGVGVNDVLAAEPVFATAQPALLEQIFLSLLSHVEQAVAKAPEKLITLRAFPLASLALLEISWREPALDVRQSDPKEDDLSSAPEGFSLVTCRDLIRGQGGRLQFSRDPSGDRRFEVALPLSSPNLTGSTSPDLTCERATLPLTTLILEPESATRQSLATVLSGLGHRCVPASNVSEAVDLAGRLRFHVFFCSATFPHEVWLECFEKVRGHVDTFVLLTQRHDPALAAALPAGEAHLLAKPVRTEELTRLIESAQARAANARR